MPKWAKSAATVLSDKQLEFLQENEDGPLTPAHAKPILDHEKIGETVGGTVSRKDRTGKWGFTCDQCSWVPKNKEQPPDWIPLIWKPHDNEKQRYMPAHWPDRCRKCKSRMKRWTKAAEKYDQLEILRVMEGRHCLRFVTFTKEEWNVKIPEQPMNWELAESIKKKAVRQFKNWRFRNKY